MCEVVRYEFEGIVPPGMMDNTGIPEGIYFQIRGCNFYDIYMKGPLVLPAMVH